MSSSVSLNHRFLIWAAAAIVAGSFGVILVSSSFNNARHHLTNALVSRATGKSGTTQIAWYELAHVTSPGDPVVGLLLAQAQLKQGATDTATKLLSHYPGYLPAVQERGQILVRQERFSQAIAVLQPGATRSLTAAYWLAVAQSEAEQGSAALATLSKATVAGDQSAVLLRDLLRLAVGQVPDTTVSSPGAVEALAQARTGILPLALELYRLGLLNTSERVLTSAHQVSLPNWTLQAQIALSHPVPDLQTAEADYYQAYLLDPTDRPVGTELQALATKLKDQSMLDKLSQLQSQLPMR